jgi:hypothetical protein
LRSKYTSEDSFLKIATDRQIVLRALKIALIVGTLLCVINHGDAMAAGTLSSSSIIKMLLTYAVPYCVSTYSGVQAIRDRLR